MLSQEITDQVHGMGAWEVLSESRSDLFICFLTSFYRVPRVVAREINQGLLTTGGIK